MSSTNEEDPFLQVQQDVISQLHSTRPLFSSYLRIRSLSTAATFLELSSARAELETALGSLAEDLADLVESVRAVEDNPAQYGLTVNEVTRRKRLVQEVGGEVGNMRAELAKRTAAEAGKARNHLPEPNSFHTADSDGEDDYTADFENQQQLQMMREQDQHLEGVFHTVGTLRRQADDMGRELEEQVEMLEVTENLMDRVGGRLQTGMAKLNHIARRSEEKWSSCCIAVLVAVLVILLVLLLIL